MLPKPYMLDLYVPKEVKAVTRKIFTRLKGFFIDKRHISSYEYNVRSGSAFPLAKVQNTGYL